MSGVPPATARAPRALARLGGALACAASIAGPLVHPGANPGTGLGPGLGVGSVARTLSVSAPPATAPVARPAVDEVCPWCKGDPVLMRACGVVSHGPQPLGAWTEGEPAGSARLAEVSRARAWCFLETPHLRLAFALGDENVDARDRERVAAQLARLARALPEVPLKPRKLDPWLRLHLLALACEDAYARFQEILGVRDEDFPAQRRAEGPYMGNGSFLGEKDKFEVIVHASRAGHQAFTSSFSGGVVHDTLRDHLVPQHKLVISIPGEDADLSHDRTLVPHVVHNLSHAFLCAYKHFSYDAPLWLDEGLAHALEKEVDPSSSTFDGEEGGLADVKGPKDWSAEVRKLRSAGKTAPFATLLHAQSFAQLDVDLQVQSWSRVRYLIDVHPRAFAAFVGGVKGQLDERGYPSGADLPGLQRRLLRELWGWTPEQFDAAWLDWVGSGD